MPARRQITRDDALGAIAELGTRPTIAPWRSPTGYWLVEGGRRYAPKAVLGLARHRAFGDPLVNDFPGGIRGANAILTRLGFRIIAIDEPSTKASPRRARWSSAEFQIVVDAYLDLLVAELKGRLENKRALVRHILPQLQHRSSASLEYAFANVSAVLVEEHLPRVAGYAPRPHYQAGLRPVVMSALDGPTDIRHVLLALVDRTPSEGSLPPGAAAAPRRSEVEDAAPSGRRPPRRRRPPAVGGQWSAERDARNRKLGRDGEEWVLRLEKRELLSRGRRDLAERVVWTSVAKGDGFGYDIESFDPDGVPIVIEVKTTNLSADTPFYMTRNEMEAARDRGQRFRLYRVSGFSVEPRFYVLEGPLESQLDLEPIQWRASPVASV